MAGVVNHDDSARNQCQSTKPAALRLATFAFAPIAKIPLQEEIADIFSKNAGRSRRRDSEQMSGSHSRSSSQERIPAEVERDMLGMRAQILDNIQVWYSLKHPGRTFEFHVVTASYKTPSSQARSNSFSACVICTTMIDGRREIHSKHDVRNRDAYREDTSKTRIEALEILLADLEWRMDLCMHQYETKLKRAPRADRMAWSAGNHSSADSTSYLST